MKFLVSDPLEQTWLQSLGRVDPAYKKAFFVVVGISLLAFGFEMTNLTLHHDDVIHIFIEDTILGHYLGRFGFGRLHYYSQNAYIMPFLQMLQGILLMTAYALLIAHFWGARRTLDIALIATILCVFPFMAQIYQYNTSMVASPMAHLLAAAAVILSTRATLLYVAAGAILYVAAFSIYQSVIANAATIFCVWVLSKALFSRDDVKIFSATMAKSVISAAIAVVAGGALYLAAVSTMGLKFDSYQAADQAFSMKGILNISSALEQIIQGSRGFFRWPENYFPGYLKNVQLVFFVAAATVCVFLPRGLVAKASAVVVLAGTLFTPRILQLLHPEGTYHNLALTAYAVVVAGFVMIVNRAGPTLVRNLSSLLALFLIAGYVLQCNWISTVNYLNTLAHYSTLTQVLARIRSIPDAQWDGKRIAVVGRYDMTSAYPHKAATGVATEFMDAAHMQYFANLMRDNVTFVPADDSTHKVLEYAEMHSPWPHPGSVGVVDGMGVVVFSNEKQKKR